ncbi:MAG: hypothetical protein HN501_02140, partial [Waddliaceae bacterium]|nr:hypothetical protein [Waddliaceae bacterium]
IYVTAKADVVECAPEEIYVAKEEQTVTFYDVSAAKSLFNSVVAVPMEEYRTTYPMNVLAYCDTRKPCDYTEILASEQVLRVADRWQEAIVREAEDIREKLKETDLFLHRLCSDVLHESRMQLSRLMTSIPKAYEVVQLV